MALGGAGAAFAADTTPFGTTPSTGVSVDSNLLTTYGVRAGSAGGDFLGISNTNYDFTSGSASSSAQYTAYTSATSRQLAGLSIWATDVNESANPYYTNLLYHAVTGTASGQYEATTWMSNPETSSWGDSNGSASTVAATGEETIAGLEYDPDIIFGASKYISWGNWIDGPDEATNFGAYLAADEDDDTVYANNDATNVWTQIYSIGQLAVAADGLTDDSEKYTRYNESDAEESALSYEKAIRGNLLYIASQIDSGAIEKKTVAYLYAIDENGTAYFFTPTADGLLEGDDTNTVSDAVSNADDNYASNNSTINMGYMATLPYITNTFDSGTELEGGIVMKVEDIYKSNPTCIVASSNGYMDSVLADVDIIIYNTSTASSLAGTSGGKNSSGIEKAYSLTDYNVTQWASVHGFTGTVIGGDDFGTSTNQSTEIETAPLLYCQRNYTTDKDTRAAWGFSKVYPELYGNNDDATYGYWVDEVYHVNTDSVAKVVAYMTNQDESDVTYTSATNDMIEEYAEIGYQWWVSTGSSDEEWSNYAYYNGSSRASFYVGREVAAAEEGEEAEFTADDATASEEPADTIGIFAPSSLWASAFHPADTATLEDQVAAAEALTESDYTAATWATLDEALAAAKTVLANESATQTEVDEALAALQDAITALATTDASDLNALIAQAEALTAANYTDRTWTALEEALAAAKVVLADESATQSDIDNAAADLEDAIEGLGTVSADTTFNDVATTDWFYNSVTYAAAQGIVTGYTDGSGNFGPFAELTRADFVTILWRYAEPAAYAAYDASTAEDTTGFGDAVNGQYYTEAINWAKDNGVTTGYDNGDFGVEDSITFQDMVVMIQRYADGGATVDSTALGNLASFADYADIDNYAIVSMAWGYENGVFSGYDDGSNTVKPTEEVYRARAVEVIYNCIQSGIL